MSLHRIGAEEAVAHLERFDAVIDARSEDEHALDRLPGAVNWPTLDNAQRITIGTLYKQVNAFEARKQGAVLAARNIAAHIERHALDKPKGWSPLVYCWRGGQRSGALATVLSAIGFRVQVLEGGYKAFRQLVMAQTPALAQALDLRVLCGPTGVGKTRLLQALELAGAQVLDLEALAVHRSSVLGLVPGSAQPSQKRFETLLWERLQRLDPTRVVYVEAESKRVGNLTVPEALMQRMRASPCLTVSLPTALRVRLLMQDYPHFVQDPEALCERLETLVPLKGRELIQQWQSLARQDIAAVVAVLLEQHYDPTYEQSMQRNFAGYAPSSIFTPAGLDGDAYPELARRIRTAVEGL